MTTTTTTIILLVLIIIAAGYIIYNLLKTVEIYEEDILVKDQFISRIILHVDETDKILNNPKIRMGFENDDETGQYFKKMKALQLILSGYALEFKEDKK